MAPKVVVITGCSTGIGLQTAVLLASDEEGRFKVFATMRNLAKQDQLKTAAGDTLDKTLFIRQLDVSKEDSIVSFIETINGEEGGADILINNAGIGQGGAVEKVTMQQIRTVYETNVFGLIRLTQAVVPGMKVKKSGHIINVGSMAGLYGVPFADVYASTKFAVEGFSESIAPLLQEFNIGVSVIEPGPVQTAFVGNISANKTGEFGTGTISVDPDVDEFTLKLYKTSTEAMKRSITSMMQRAEDIALVIKEAILSDKPHLHYPKSEAMHAMAAFKLIDPTGESVVKNLVVRLNGGTQ